MSIEVLHYPFYTIYLPHVNIHDNTYQDGVNANENKFQSVILILFMFSLSKTTICSIKYCVNFQDLYGRVISAKVYITKILMILC